MNVEIRKVILFISRFDFGFFINKLVNIFIYVYYRIKMFISILTTPCDGVTAV